MCYSTLIYSAIGSLFETYDFRIVNLIPAFDIHKIFSQNIRHALFRHGMLTLYKPYVSYAKIDEHIIYIVTN